MRLASILGGLAAVLLFPNLIWAAEPLAQRWVTAGGARREWVILLGAESRLEGGDTNSRNPASLTKLPSVGYQRQLAAEGLLALRPDLLLGSEDMGPPPVLEQLAVAGVRIERLSARAELDSLQANLQRLGQLLGDEAAAERAFTDYQARLQTQQQWVEQAQRRQQAPGVVLLLGHAGGSPLAGGSDTAADWMIRRAGGRNLVSHGGYKALSSEALLALDPQVVVVADRALDGDAAKQALLRQNPALASTRTGREGRLLALDPTLLVGGLGPRVPDGLAMLAAGFYPASQPLTAEAKRKP